MADSCEEALAYFRSLDHGDLVDETLEAFVDKGPEALAFLEDIEALKVAVLPGYPDYYLDRPGAKPEGSRALDHDLFALGELGEWAAKIYAIEEPKPLMLRETPLGGATAMPPLAVLGERMAARQCGFGQAMVARLLRACLARGIEPMLGVETKRLVKDGERITGIEGTRDGQPFAMTARRGVILTTGGFEWDEDLRQTFLRGPVTAPASPPTGTGGGLKLAMAAGAKLGNMTSAWWAPTLVTPDAPWASGEQRAQIILIERTVPHSIMVNRKATRFCNEAANYSALGGVFHQFDPANYDYLNLPAYLIFDAQYAERYPLGTRQPGQPIPDWVMRADTLEGLAEQIGLDPAALVETVARFNVHADEGHDPEGDGSLAPHAEADFFLVATARAIIDRQNGLLFRRHGGADGGDIGHSYCSRYLRTMYRARTLSPSVKTKRVRPSAKATSVAATTPTSAPGTSFIDAGRNFSQPSIAPMVTRPTAKAVAAS